MKSTLAYNTLNKLNLNKIKYCHWKSNANLNESFNGKTDFDILVAKEDCRQFTELLSRFGFKRRFSTGDKLFPGMEDYIGFDTKTGKLVHFHVHYSLVLGKELHKNYVIPFEDMILSTSIVHESYPIMIALPELELILLIIRILLKTKYDTKTLVKLILRKEIVPANLKNEVAYLLIRIDKTKFQEYLKIANFKVAPFLKFIEGFESGFSLFEYFFIRASIKKLISIYRRFGISKIRNEFKSKRFAKRNSRSWFPSGGVCLGFVGSDGSGKSTTVAIIEKWLSWKVSVKTVYMGLPKQKGIVHKSFILAEKLFSNLKCRNISNCANDLRWLYIAKQRYKLFLKANQWKNQGHIVLFDRYPLETFWDMSEPMDGPRISGKSFFSKMERNYYMKIYPPDFLFILRVDIEEALRRKSDYADENKYRRTIEAKISAVNKLITAENSKHIYVETIQDHMNTVILDIKRKLWEIS